MKPAVRRSAEYLQKCLLYNRFEVHASIRACCTFVVGNGAIVSGRGASSTHHSMIDCRRTSSSSPARRRPPPPPPAACPPVPPRPAPDTFNIRARRPSDVPQSSLSSEDEIRAAFHVFDIDGNGLIDSDELRLTMSRFGEHVTQSDVDVMIRAVDRNDDGKVDYEGQTQLSSCVSRVLTATGLVNGNGLLSTPYHHTIDIPPITKKFCTGDHVHDSRDKPSLLDHFRFRLVT